MNSAIHLPTHHLLKRLPTLQPAPLLVAEGTAPTSADPRSAPLLVTSYDSRLVEIVNGRVKAHAGPEPAYVSQPLSEAAHSPRRSPSRTSLERGGGGALGSLSSVNSLSHGAL